MKRRFEPFLLLGFAATAMFAQDQTPPDAKADARLVNATTAVREIMHSPDKGIPHDLIEKSQCVVVVPDLLKGAFLVGGQYGRGYATCRHDGGWTTPAAVRMEGGSFGFQLGGSSTDLIMLVMNRKGMDRLLGDKFTIGGEAAAAAGPIGRQTSADTDLAMHAEILTWSRARGVFAGISLAGATLRPDKSEDRRLYGREVTNRQILDGEVPAPPATRAFIAEIRRSSLPLAEAHNNLRRPVEDRGPRAMLTDQPIQFASGETSVPASAEPVLAQVTQKLKDNPAWKVRIEGFSDRSGSMAANRKISHERAEAVKNWLADHGVNRDQMVAVGRGAERPIGDNATDEGRAQNRRVEIVRADVVMNRTGF
jgi:SH3 domain-containing YSC84-like protein 1